MSRPCSNKHPTPRKGACPHCTLYLTDDKWRTYWDGPDSPPPTPTAPERRAALSPTRTNTPKPPCIHLGEPTGDMEDCPTCTGKVSLKLFECDVHHVCTIQKPLPNIACCASCPEYSPVVAPIIPVTVSVRPGEGEALISCQVCGMKDARIRVNDPGGSDMVKRLRTISPTLALVHKKRFPKCVNDKLDVQLPYNYDPNMVTWSYGLTTVPSRFDTTLPRTLQSLKLAGFSSPRLFVDQWDGQDTSYHHLGLEVTYHQGELQPFGNWYLALWELWIRNPTAHRYALFQDDFVCVKNLRQYLEACPYPKRGYLNLYTAFKLHEMLVEGKEKGWHEGGLLNPPDRNPGLLQKGLGAVALVFNNEAVQVLLSSPTMKDKPKAADKLIRYRKVDGGIVTAMNLAGWREYVHNPSLVQHIGTISSCGNNDTQGKCKHPQALTFPGEQFDAMSLVRREHATT